MAEQDKNPDYGFQSEEGSAGTNGLGAGANRAQVDSPVYVRITPDAGDIQTNPAHASSPGIPLFSVAGKFLGFVNTANDAVSVGTPIALSVENSLNGDMVAAQKYADDATVQAGGVIGQGAGVWVGGQIGSPFGIPGVILGAGLGALGGSPLGQTTTQFILDNTPTRLEAIPDNASQAYTLGEHQYIQSNGKWYLQTTEAQLDLSAKPILYEIKNPSVSQALDQVRLQTDPEHQQQVIDQNASSFRQSEIQQQNASRDPAEQRQSWLEGGLSPTGAQLNVMTGDDAYRVIWVQDPQTGNYAQVIYQTNTDKQVEQSVTTYDKTGLPLEIDIYRGDTSSLQHAGTINLSAMRPGAGETQTETHRLTITQSQEFADADDATALEMQNRNDLNLPDINLNLPDIKQPDMLSPDLNNILNLKPVTETDTTGIGGSTGNDTPTPLDENALPLPAIRTSGNINDQTDAMLDVMLATLTNPGQTPPPFQQTASLDFDFQVTDGIEEDSPTQSATAEQNPTPLIIGLNPDAPWEPGTRQTNDGSLFPDPSFITVIQSNTLGQGFDLNNSGAGLIDGLTFDRQPEEIAARPESDMRQEIAAASSAQSAFNLIQSIQNGNGLGILTNGVNFIDNFSRANNIQSPLPTEVGYGLGVLGSGLNFATALENGDALGIVSTLGSSTLGSGLALQHSASRYALLKDLTPMCK
jgi:hypothetical protein